jgi:type II secretion system protein N
MKLKIRWKINGYTLGMFAFTGAVLIVMLYLRFPGDAAVPFLVSAVEEKNPGAIFRIDAAKPVMPPGIRFSNVTMGFRDNPLSMIQADRITMSPAYLTLLKGLTAISFSADAYGGVVQGQAGTDHFLSFQGPLNWEMKADGIRIERIGCLKELLGRQITGKFKGAMTLAGPNRTLANGTGNLEFTLTNGSYPLRESIMGIDRLDFTQVEAHINLKNGILTIAKLKLTGGKAGCTLSGNIDLNATDIKSSHINLNAAVEFSARSKIAMVLTGPLGNPTIKYL